MSIDTSKPATQPANTTIPSTPLRFVWSTTRPSLPWLILGVLFSVATQLLNTFSAVFIGNFTDAALSITAPEQLGWWAVWFVLLLSAVFLLFRLSGFLAITLVLKQQTLAFEQIKQYLLQHSHTYFINRFAGSIASKVFHAGDRSGELLLMSYFGFVRLTVTLLATGAVMAVFSGWLAAVYFLIVGVTIVVNIFLVRRRRPNVVEYAEATSRYRGQITDVVSNIQAVRQYSRTSNEYGWLRGSLIDRIEKDRTQWRMAEWNHTINNILTIVMMIGVMGGVYWLLVQGMITVGVMVTVMILVYRISSVMVDLGDWMNRFIRIYGEVEEGLKEITVPHEIVDLPEAMELQASVGQIAWQNVIFEYDQNRVFDNFNLTIKPGQRVGLVGPSGAGKTTFVSLMLRQHDIGAGAIMIDGQNIAEVTQDSLRQNIAVVPQEPLLFHRSIRENIAYGKPNATQSEIRAVAAKAQALDFILDLPEKFDTLVGERGVKLSGGQKQRVAIARAMLKDAPILVLDEATSALDSESEVLIQKALHELMEGKTVVAIAHRLSTLREMDRILVLEDGQIVEDGTHEELAQAGGTYARLWDHQAGGFLQD